MLKEQFIRRRGVRSSSIQLELMRGSLSALEEALQLSSRQECIEDAQRRLHGGGKTDETASVSTEYNGGEQFVSTLKTDNSAVACRVHKGNFG